MTIRCFSNLLLFFVLVLWRDFLYIGCCGGLGLELTAASQTLEKCDRLRKRHTMCLLASADQSVGGWPEGKFLLKDAFIPPRTAMMRTTNLTLCSGNIWRSSDSRHILYAGQENSTLYISFPSWSSRTMSGLVVWSDRGSSGIDIQDPTTTSISLGALGIYKI